MSLPKWRRKALRRARRELAEEWANPVQASELMGHMGFSRPMKPFEADTFVKHGLIDGFARFKHGWKRAQFAVSVSVSADEGPDGLEAKEPMAKAEMERFLGKYLRRWPVREFVLDSASLKN